MKLNNLMMIAAAAALGFTACNKEEGLGDNGGTPKSVSVSLGNVMSPSRSMEPEVTENAVTLNDFNVLFVDAAGKLYKGKTAEGDTDATYFFDLKTTQKDLTEITKDELTFHFLSPSVTKVVVVGNVGELTFEEGKTLAEVLADDDNLVIADEQNVDALSLYGDGELEYTSGAVDDAGHPALYTAEVELAPRVSRVEVTGFTYKTADDGMRDYSEIDITRVALADYYSNSTLIAGTVSGTPQAVDNDNVGEYLSDCASAGSVWYYDRQDGVDLKAVDYAYMYSGNRPAYNFFPSGNKLPQLIVGLVGKTDSGDEPTTLITKSYTVDGEGAIDNNAGKVYKVDFSFDDDDFADPQRCVEVTVEVMDWVVVNVTPSFR